MRCLCFGWVLLGMGLIAHAAEPEHSPFFLAGDRPSLRILQFNTDGMARSASYRLSLHIVPIRSTAGSPYASGFSTVSPLPSIAEGQKDVAWANGAHLTKYFDRSSPLVRPLLRLESNGERFEIRPRRHSLSIHWSKALP